jgi:(p)ppGpp synthase/HD superfamily hydrolase
MNDLERRAINFAKDAHADQTRKYTGEPYFVHLEEVAQIVKSVGGTAEMVSAAYLHDTVEDTETTIEEIREQFGPMVAELVGWLTDVSKPSDGNRRTRKDLDLLHTAASIPDAKTIKLADLISNSRSIVEHDKDFARVYLNEKARLLEVLTDGNPILYKQASDALIQGKLKLMDETKK